MAISSGRYVSITSSVVPSITSSISGGGGGVTPIPPDPEPNPYPMSWLNDDGSINCGPEFIVYENQPIPCGA